MQVYSSSVVRSGQKKRAHLPTSPLKAPTQQITFSAQGSHQPRRAGVAARLALLAVLAGFGGVAAPQTAGAQTKSTDANGRLCVDESRYPVVGSAADLDFLSVGSLKLPNGVQNVVDICQNPYLSPAARETVENLLDQYRDAQTMDTVVVVVPNTQEGVAPDVIGQDLIEQMRLGNGNGVVIVVSRDRVYANTPGKMGIGYDLNYKDLKINGRRLAGGDNSRTRELLIQYAQSQISAGNYDAAVIDTVNALAPLMAEANAALEDQGSVNTPGQAPESHDPQPNPLVEHWQTLLMILGMVIAAASAGGGAYSFYNRRKPHVDDVNDLLTSIGSQHKASLFNVHSAETIRELLNPNAPQAMNLNADNLLWVLRGIFADPKQAAEKRRLLLELGVSHPKPDVRIAMIQSLYNDRTSDNDPDLFSALIGLLKSEENERVLNTLEDPLVNMANEENAGSFEETIKSPLPDVRRTGIRVLDKFFDADPKHGTMPKFFNLLEGEQEASIIEVLQKGIAEKTAPEYTSIFTERMAKTNLNVKQSALRSLAALKDPNTFQPVIAQYASDAADAEKQKQQTPPAQQEFVSALQATARKEHLGDIYPMLTHQLAAMEAMGIRLLGHLKEAGSVPTLFEYFKNEKSRFAPQAMQVVVQSVNENSRPLLLEQLKLSGETNALSRQAAVKGLAHLLNVDDLPEVIKALETEDAEFVQQEMHDAMFAYGKQEAAFAILTAALAQSEHQLVLLAAADAMKQYPTLQALPPLYDTLDQREAQFTKKNLQPVTQRLNENILEISRDTESLSFLLEKETSSNPSIKTVSQTGVVNMIQAWDKATGYDNDPVLETIRQLSAHQNQAIATQGGTTLKNFIDRKIADVQNTGEKGDFGQGQFFAQCAVPMALAALIERATSKRDASVVRAAQVATEQLRTRRDQHEQATADQLAQAADKDEDRAQQELSEAERASSSRSAKKDLTEAVQARNSAQRNLEKLQEIERYAINSQAIAQRTLIASQELEKANRAVEQIDAIEKRLRQAEAVTAANQAANNAASYASQARSAASSASSSSSSSSARSYASNADRAADNADGEVRKIRSIMEWAVDASALNRYLSSATSSASSARSSANSASSRVTFLVNKERTEATSRSSFSSSSHGSSGRGGGGGDSI